MNVIGCDCGGDGALYELLGGAATGWSGWQPGDFLRMPMIDVGKRIKEVDIGVIVRWLKDRESPTLFVIESVGYMPSGDGKSGFAGGGFGNVILSARYNKIVGMLETIATVNGKPAAFPFTKVTPQTWKSKLDLKVPSIKGESRERKTSRAKAATLAFIKQRYPTAVLVPTRARKENDGLVDALALAHYGTLILSENMVIPKPNEP